MESTTATWLQPVSLEGRHVRLEPLLAADADDLRTAACDGKLWTLWYTSVPSPDGVEAYVATAIAERDAGLSLPFTVRDADGAIVGRAVMSDRT